MVTIPMDTISSILLKDRHDLTNSDKRILLTALRTIMAKLWDFPYKEDQNGNWRVQYLRDDCAFDYLLFRNDSNVPTIAFEKLFDTHDFKRLIQMAINLMLKNVDSKNQ